MIASIIKQILSALIYNQSQGKEIYHKELRPDNLMIEDSSLDIPALKINDFSTAVEFNPKDKKNKKNRKITFSCLYFTPPEIICKLGYNKKSDIWSVGVLLFILLTGKNPIKDISNKCTIINIKSKNFKIEKLVEEGLIDEEAGLLLGKMLNRDLRARISAIEAMNDPWVIKYSKNETDDSTLSEGVKEDL